MPKPKIKSNRWRVEWSELKLVALRLLKGDTSDFELSHNKGAARNYVEGGRWDGFTQGQLQAWLTSGFQTDAIQNLDEFIPPIREKRKLRYTDEGDEFHYDLAASGVDNYMSEWTKRDEIPGLAIDAEIGMVCTVDASVLNAYYTWLCRVAFSIESAGIDTEITLRYEMARHAFNTESNKPFTTVIRVKSENEATDFLSWSAMLSPASFRSLMFIADTLHAEARGYEVSRGQGQRDHGAQWTVEFQPETRTLRITCPWNASSFPADSMTVQLRAALAEATQKA